MKTSRLRLPHRSPPRWRLVCALLLILLPRLIRPPLAAEGPPTVSLPILDPASVSPGADVAIRVQFQGTGPFTYKWQFHGTDIDSAINPTAAQPELKLTNITLAQEGPYRVIVSNASGSASSPEAVLDVDPTFTVVPTSSIGGEAAARSRWAVWVDYDGDGDPDLLQLQSRLSFDAQIELYRNHGDGTFNQVSVAEGGALLDFRISGGTMGWGDYDNDRWPDLSLGWAVGYYEMQPSKLFHNDHGRFRNIYPANVGISESCLFSWWVDFDSDGFLDFIGLDIFNPYKARFRNRGNGTFARILGGRFGRSYPVGWCDTVAASDYDNDGDLDFFVCNHGNWFEPGSLLPNELYRNDGGDQLTEITGDPVTATPGFYTGAVWADFNNDGFPDLFVANYAVAAETVGVNHLFLNNRNGTFTAATDSVVMQEGGASRYAAAGDYDNDGWVDLCVGNQIVKEQWNFGPTNLFVYHNNGDGTFAKVTTGSPATALHTTLAGWVDYNNDGFLDLSAWGYPTDSPSSVDGPWGLYRNNGNANRWLNVRLVGKASNSFGIGAKVRVQATLNGKPLRQLREVMATGTDMAVFVPTAHFGLADATVVDTVRIEWPSGIVQELTDVAPNQTLNIVETQPAADKTSTFTAFSRPAGGKFQATATFATGLLGVFEGSTDLATWTKIMVRTNTTGTVQFEDSWAGTRPLCFYRVLVP